MFAALMAGSLGGCKFLKKEKKAFGQECVTDLDCVDLMCSTTGNICTKTCTYDKDCGGDLVCRTKDDGSGNWCSKPVGTAPNGSCMNSWDCQHNHCLKYVDKEEQPGICSKYCQTEADCPDGMKICTKISDSGLLKLCIPGDPKAEPTSRPQFSPTPVTPRGTPAPRPRPRPAAAPPPPPPRQPDPPAKNTPAKGRPPAKHR
ncbi:MAG: hypothetical protein QM820_47990 [Minicystis sp.]